MAASKVYSGRLLKGIRVVRVRSESVTTALPCLDFFTPSFAWGYHGGACDELAIAILHDHLGPSSAVFQERVLGLYRAFVDEVISKFEHGEAWTLTAGSVDRWIVRHEKLVPA